METATAGFALARPPVLTGMAAPAGTAVMSSCPVEPGAQASRDVHDAGPRLEVRKLTGTHQGAVASLAPTPSSHLPAPSITNGACSRSHTVCPTTRGFDRDSTVADTSARKQAHDAHGFPS